ncbi:MAG: tRNA (guanine-N1)-methyltransferase, partial [Nitrosarchaeum sp.]
VAGPLWIDKIFDKEFVEDMISKIPDVTVDKVCEKALQKCFAESEMPGIYFTLDEIASKMKSSPPKLEDAIKNLQKNGYLASTTSFCPTGFRTNANINEIISIFRSTSKS